MATRHASANKVRHALRRWRVLTDRLKAKEIKLITLPGVNMPADFMTRNTDRKKVNASVAYATNAANAVPRRTIDKKAKKKAVSFDSAPHGV